MAHNQTLLADIEQGLLKGEPLADLLRKCVLLGGRSGSQDLIDWAKRELRGYTADDTLPGYRHVSAVILLDGITGAYVVRGQPVSAGALPDFAREAGLGNDMPLRQGVGELESLVSGRAPTKAVHMLLPGSEVIGTYIDERSGNPFQHTHSVYWAVSPSAIAGVLDNIRTSLAELLAELVRALPPNQDLPTSAQADNAVQVVVNGKRPQVTVLAATASDNAVSTVEQGSTATESREPGWWTFGRKVAALVVSLFVVAGAIATIVALYA